MKNIFFLGLLFVSAIFISCSQQAADSTVSTVCLDLEKNIGFKNTENIKPQDLKVIQLDGNVSDFDFNSSHILDVAGDTVFMLNSDIVPTKILMFSLSTGKYLGEISHQGEGQGEYRFIFGAFVDSTNQTVLIPDIDRPYVYEYSLLTDSLIATYDRPDLPLRLQPTGNVRTGINFGDPKEEGLGILQCNSKSEVIDSLLLKGIHIIPFTTRWAQSGENGIMFDHDTLSVIGREQLIPVVSVNPGKYKLSEEKAIETMEGLICSDEPDTVYLKRLNEYIIIKEFQFTDNYILVTYNYQDRNYSDLYNVLSGEILNRSETKNGFNAPCTMVLENGDAGTVTVERLFTKDNIWYGMYRPTDPSETTDRISIVKFRIIKA